MIPVKQKIHLQQPMILYAATCKQKEFLLTAQNNNIRPVAAKPLKEQEFTIFMKDGQNIQTHLESTKYTHWL